MAKLTEVKEYVFGGDSNGDFMYKPNRIVKIKKHLPLCGELSTLCYEDRIVVGCIATLK